MQNAHRASRLWRAIAKNWGLYLLIAPSFILLLFFTYFPMYGVQIAFKDYNPWQASRAARGRIHGTSISSAFQFLANRSW